MSRFVRSNRLYDRTDRLSKARLTEEVGMSAFPSSSRRRGTTGPLHRGGRAAACRHGVFPDRTRSTARRGLDVPRLAARASPATRTARRYRPRPRLGRCAGTALPPRPGASRRPRPSSAWPPRPTRPGWPAQPAARFAPTRRPPPRPRPGPAHGAPDPSRSPGAGRRRGRWSWRAWSWPGPPPRRPAARLRPTAAIARSFVQPGDTLWSIAQRTDPGADPQAVVAGILEPTICPPPP